METDTNGLAFSFGCTGPDAAVCEHVWVLRRAVQGHPMYSSLLSLPALPQPLSHQALPLMVSPQTLVAGIFSLSGSPLGWDASKLAPT